MACHIDDAVGEILVLYGSWVIPLTMWPGPIVLPMPLVLISLSQKTECLRPRKDSQKVNEAAYPNAISSRARYATHLDISRLPPSDTRHL
jgi:hypothetical protein